MSNLDNKKKRKKWAHGGGHHKSQKTINRTLHTWLWSWTFFLHSSLSATTLKFVNSTLSAPPSLHRLFPLLTRPILVNGKSNFSSLELFCLARRGSTALGHISSMSIANLSTVCVCSMLSRSSASMSHCLFFEVFRLEFVLLLLHNTRNFTWLISTYRYKWSIVIRRREVFRQFVVDYLSNVIETSSEMCHRTYNLQAYSQQHPSVSTFELVIRISLRWDAKLLCVRNVNRLPRLSRPLIMLLLSDRCRLSRPIVELFRPNKRDSLEEESNLKSRWADNDECVINRPGSLRWNVDEFNGNIFYFLREKLHTKRNSYADGFANLCMLPLLANVPHRSESKESP